jgi:molecular chaperone Hsp33
VTQTEQPKDCAIRAITDDGAFRVITIRTTDMVRAAIKAQDATGVCAKTFAELLTGAVLVRETMSPENRVQVVLKPDHNNKGRFATLVADSHPEGLTRGLVQGEVSDEHPPRFGEGMVLQVIRVLFNKELHQGIVPTSSEGGVSQALNDYLLSSEQVTSVIEVAAHVDEDGEVVSAAGFIVQMLPEVSVEALAPMLEHLEKRPALREILADRGARPAETMAKLMDGFEHTVLSQEPVSFGCVCSQERIFQAISTLPADEIRELIEGGTQIELACEYCKTPYVVSASQLEPLLRTN